MEEPSAKSATFGADGVFRSGAPRSMKMGTIRSPWHYDYAAGFAPWRADVFRSLHIDVKEVQHDG